MINIEHSENVSFEHMAHSFVRGFFNNDRMTPMILSKACHDMDILLYLADAKPLRVSSFGGLSHFKPQNAPAGAPDFCLEGCPKSRDCPYDVRRVYFRADSEPAYLRQMGIIKSPYHLLSLLKSNRFGRCVYRCDNNVIDHQVCAFEFEGGVTASFVLDGHNGIERRRTRVHLDHAEIDLDTSRATIEIHRSNGTHESIRPRSTAGTHFGGDHAVMECFVDSIQQNRSDFVLTSVSKSLDSHLMAFGAELSRLTHQSVEMASFEKAVRDSMKSSTPEG